jgi:predicted acetyltransferase
VVGNEQSPNEGEVFLHIIANNEQRVTLKNPLKRGQQTEFQFKLPIQGVQTMEMTMESFHRAYFGPKSTFTIKLQD